MVGYYSCKTNREENRKRIREITVNNIRIFANGSCWIPGDYMLLHMTRRRYSKSLKLAKSGNQTMVHVWCGGIVR